MALSDYDVGAVTIANGSKTLQGAGTAWLSAEFQEGDVLFLSGFTGLIDTVDTEDTITLVDDWEGPTVADQPYRLRYQADLSRTAAKTQQLIDGLENLKGDTGDPGTNFAPDATGYFVDRSTHDGEAQWFSFLSIDGDGGTTTSDASLYFKKSAVSGDWSAAVPFVGPKGDAGADGFGFLSGNGAPAAAVGKDGWTYLDRQTGDLYAKAAGVWADTGSNIMGPAGPDGVSMISGNGPPADTIGADGFTYLDHQSGETYLKVDGAWSATGGNLTGPKGDTGDDGLSAYQVWLAAGNSGTEAEYIASKKGTAGAAGLSAYETWLGLGNVGTQQDFLDSLRGPEGPVGPGGSVDSFATRTGAVTPASGDYDADQVTETAARKFASPAQLDKVDLLTVTGAADIDALRLRVLDLDKAVVVRGNWNASTGVFPSNAQAGDSFIVSAAGTVDGVSFPVDGRIIALIDGASTTTYAGNWYKTRADALDGAQIKQAYEAESDTNVFNDAAKGKLDRLDADHYGPPVATVAALQALTEASLSDNERRYVAALGGDVFYDAEATSGDYAPTDQTNGTGFWKTPPGAGQTIKAPEGASRDINATDQGAFLQASAATGPLRYWITTGHGIAAGRGIDIQKMDASANDVEPIAGPGVSFEAAGGETALSEQHATMRLFHKGNNVFSISGRTSVPKEAFPYIAAQNVSYVDVTGGFVPIYPPGIQAGDLMIVVASVTDAPTHPNVPDADYALLHAVSDSLSGAVLQQSVIYKIADGLESGGEFMLWEGNGTARAAYAVLVIRNHGVSVNPSLVGLQSATLPGAIDNDTPNPPSITPSWGAKKTLFLAVSSIMGANRQTPILPAGYSLLGDEHSLDVDASTLTVAQRRAITATEDPSAFDYSADASSDDRNVAGIIAIQGTEQV